VHGALVALGVSLVSHYFPLCLIRTTILVCVVGGSETDHGAATESDPWAGGLALTNRVSSPPKPPTTHRHNTTRLRKLRRALSARLVTLGHFPDQKDQKGTLSVDDWAEIVGCIGRRGPVNVITRRTAP